MQRTCCFVEDYQLPNDRASPFQRNCHCLEKHYSTSFAKPIDARSLTKDSVTRCNACCGGFVYRENFQYCGNDHLAITGLNNDSVRYLTGGEVRTISNLNLPYLRTHPWGTPLTPCNLDRNVQVHFLRFNNSSTECLVPQLCALQNHYNLEEDPEYVHGRCNKILNDLSKNVYCTYPVDDEVFYVTSKRCTPKRERAAANQNEATYNKNLDKKVPQDPFTERYPIVLEVISPIKPVQQCDSMYIFANDDDMYAHVCSKCAAVILDTLTVCAEDSTKNQKLNNVKPHVNSGHKKKMKVDRNNMKKNKPKVTVDKPKVTMDTPKKDTQRPGRPKTRRNLNDTPQPKTKSRGQSSKSNSSKERSPGPVRKPKRSRTPSAQRAKSQEQSSRNSSANTHAAGDTRKASTEKGSCTREVESLIKDSINEHEYLQFALRITEDIIKNDLYTCNEMRRVFNSHIEANRGRLDINKMKEQVRNLAKELNVKYDNPDGYSLGPRNWVNSCGYPKDDDIHCDLIYVAKDIRDSENLDCCNRDSQRYQHKSSRCTSTSYIPPASKCICTTPLMKCCELVELPHPTDVDPPSGSMKSNKQCEELISLSCDTGVENTCAEMRKPANQDTVPVHKNVCDEKLCGLTLVVTVPDQKPSAEKLSSPAEDKQVDSIVNNLDADHKEELKQLDQKAIKTDEQNKMSRSSLTRCPAHVNFCHLHSTTMMTTEIIPDIRPYKEAYGNKQVQVDASSFKSMDDESIHERKDYPCHGPDTKTVPCKKKCFSEQTQLNNFETNDDNRINICREKDFPVHVPDTERGICEKKCSNQIDKIKASKGDDHFSICREDDCMFRVYDTGPVSYNTAPKKVAALNKLKTTDLQSAACRKPMEVKQEYLTATCMQSTTLPDDATVLSNNGNETVVIPQTQQQLKCSCPCCVKAGCDSIENDRDDVHSESLGSSQESPEKATMMTTEIIPDTRLCKEECGNKQVQVDASSFKSMDDESIHERRDYTCHGPDTKTVPCKKKCFSEQTQLNNFETNDDNRINICREKDFPVHVPDTERGICEKKCSNQIDKIKASKGDDHFSICREDDCMFRVYDTGPVSYNTAPKKVAALTKLKTIDLQSAACRKPMEVKQEYLTATCMQSTTLPDDTTVLSKNVNETAVIPQTQQQLKCSCPCCVKAGCDSIWNDRDDVYSESLGSSQESPKKDITSYIDKRIQENAPSTEPKAADCENKEPTQNGQMLHVPSNVGTQTLVSSDIDLQPEKEKIKYKCQEYSTDYIIGDTYSYKGDIPKMLAQFFPSTSTQTTSSDLLLIDETLKKQQPEKELLKKEEKLEVGTLEKKLSGVVSENVGTGESKDDVFQHPTENTSMNAATNVPQHVQYDKSYDDFDDATTATNSISGSYRPSISNDESNLIKSVSDNIQPRRFSRPYSSTVKAISGDLRGKIGSASQNKSYDSNSDESIGRIFDDNEMCEISHSIKSTVSANVPGKTAKSTSDVQGKTAKSTSGIQEKRASNTSDVQGKTAKSTSGVQEKTASNTRDIQGKTPSNLQKRKCDNSSYESTDCAHDDQASLFSHCSISIIISEEQQQKQKSKQSIISDHTNDELEQEKLADSKEKLEKNPSDIDTFMNKLDYRPRVSVTGSMDKRVKKTLTEGEMFRNPEIRRTGFETQSGIDLNVDQTIVEDTERRTHKEDDSDSDIIT